MDSASEHTAAQVRQGKILSVSAVAFFIYQLVNNTITNLRIKPPSLGGKNLQVQCQLKTGSSASALAF
jgi:hypothetical protein